LKLKIQRFLTVVADNTTNILLLLILALMMSSSIKERATPQFVQMNAQEPCRYDDYEDDPQYEVDCVVGRR
jgi:hypothetical protein